MGSRIPNRRAGDSSLASCLSREPNLRFRVTFLVLTFKSFWSRCDTSDAVDANWASSSVSPDSESTIISVSVGPTDITL